MEVEANKHITPVSADQFWMDNMRIFVGGLGEGVTDDDLRRMFAALGRVDEIEIIRSKGRNIAYLNFTPSSAKSLAKLFSSFNGCVWKGGKLRIEKAKEHYLAKMEREREKEKEEEAARNDAVMKRTAEVVTLKKPTKGPGAEKEQIRIFFPKLRKVKPLPFGGCGKHKYSFRNIPVPSLPTHFCDCELHYVPYDAPIETGGVDEKEFDLMHSVLNKLIARDEGAVPNGNGGLSSLSDDILASDENAPNSEPDEDGIIINISGAMKETDFSWKSEDRVSEYQGSRDNHPQAFKVDDKRQLNSNNKRTLGDGSNETDNQSHKKKKDGSNAASALPLGSNSLRTKNSKWKELVGVGTDSSFKLSNVLSREAVQESVQQEDTEDESSMSEDQDDETEASADESAHDTDELSNSKMTDDEAEGSTGESGESNSDEESSKSEESGDVVEEESRDEFAKQEDAEEESSKSEDSDSEVMEESSDKLANHEDIEDGSNKLEESDDEVDQEFSDDLAKQENSEDESNKLEESDDEVDQEPSDNLAIQEDTEDETNNLEESDDELEQESSDDLAEQEDTEDELDKLDESDEVIEESSDEVAEQEDTEEASTELGQPVTKPGENKQSERVKFPDTESGSVKKGATWSQVMPWTQLVSDLDNSCFSISQILPSTNAPQVEAKPSLKLKDVSTRQSPKAVKVETTLASLTNITNPHPGENSALEAVKSEDEKPTTQVVSAPKPVVREDTYESRPFMRSAASLKEWAKLKETLRKSGTKKRKTPEE